MEIKEELRQKLLLFLKNHKIDSETQLEILTNFDSVYDYGPMINVINRALRWSDTKEGHKFWFLMQCRWANFIYKFWKSSPNPSKRVISSVANDMLSNYKTYVSKLEYHKYGKLKKMNACFFNFKLK